MEGIGDISEVIAFESATDARRVVADICGAVGLPANFKVYAVDEPNVNAYATVRNGERLIVYSVNFMRGIADKTSRDWSGLTVMAHEIGHHLAGHTLDGHGSRPPKELEADHFAGFAVARLGGSLQNAIKVFEGFSEVGSATHPPRQNRIVAVRSGWKKGAINSRSSEERHNLVTHNRDRPVIVEFVGDGTKWTEFQHGQLFATFEELRRDGSSIFLFDDKREFPFWVKLDVSHKGGFAVGYWARGERTPLPTSWTPLDPRQWR